MHPFFRNTRNLILALIFWSPFCLGMALVLHRLTGTAMSAALILVTPPMLFLFILALSTWVICRYSPFGPRAILRLLLTHLTSAAAMSAFSLLLFRLYAYLLVRLLPGSDWLALQKKLQLIFLLTTVILYLLAVFFNYLLMAIDRSRQTEKQLLQSELSRSRSELQALRATIHPHFLFNSLTALSVLIINDPPRGREVCLQLADFLRFTMKMTTQRFICVAEEIDHLRNYLGIEQVRLGARLQVAWEIDDTIADARMPPMLLQPLAENAIKHGIQPRLEGGKLRVQVQRRGEYVQAVVANPLADEISPVSGTKLGLETLRKRLRDEYGDKAELHADSDGETFSVSLRLPLTFTDKRSKS